MSNYRKRLPEDLIVSVMALRSGDRFHAKQGRSTARVVLDRTDRPLAVYLKRHFQLPWPSPAWRRSSTRRGDIPRRRPNGPTSNASGHWESRCPRLSQPASTSVRGRT